MSTRMGPVRSMTGFARVRRNVEAGELVVSIKSVNHRGLDIRIFGSSDLDAYENAMRAALARAMARGHVELRVSLASATKAAGVEINEAMLSAYLEAFRQAGEKHGLSCAPDLNAALRLPGMFQALAEPERGSAFEAELIATIEEALDLLNAFREREGAELALEIRSRVGMIAEAAGRMEEIRARAAPLFHARLQQRLSELLIASSIDSQRLAQEAALLAERSDVGEELVRLKIHNAQIAQMLDSGGEVGKRLDFLLQELHREANTILSKTSGIGDAGIEMTDLALAVKADIEKIREQSLNLE